MGRDTDYPLTNKLKENLDMLVDALSKFESIDKKNLRVSSGYRPDLFNKNANGAKKSNHMVCLACDFYDMGSTLDKYCIENLDVLEECGLYLEHPMWTRGWCHLQCIAPASGNRVFIPSNDLPSSNNLDKKFSHYEY